MNKKLKSILIGINILILFVAGYWLYTKKNDPEPITVILGQIATIALLLLLFEEKATKIFTKNVNKSSVKIKRKKTDEVHTEDIYESDIDIQ